MSREIRAEEVRKSHRELADALQAVIDEPGVTLGPWQVVGNAARVTLLMEVHEVADD